MTVATIPGQPLLAAGASRTVYGFTYPEVKAVIDELWASRPHFLYHSPWLGQQDTAHLPLLHAWETWVSEVIDFRRNPFPFHYYTNGSTEGIRDVIADYASGNDEYDSLYVLAGEYEGYRAVAEAYPLDVRTIHRTTWQSDIRGMSRRGVLFISQPSAIDGTVWPDFELFLEELHKVRPEIEVYVDLSYVGCVAKPYSIGLDSPNIRGVLWSLSKPFGVYYHRIGGMLTRQPRTVLDANKWFKNLFSIELGRTLLERFPVRSLAERYLPVQAAAVKHLREHTGRDARASDVVLLAHERLGDVQDLPPEMEDVRRAATLRFCLTPSFAQLVSDHVE